MASFLETYGYLALFVGTFFEGEAILALAGLAAHEGLMTYPRVVTVAIFGGFLGDQFYFFLGRRYGNRILNRFPSLAAKAPRIKVLLRRWNAPVVVLIRFMYGLRVAGPIIIGSAGISPWRLAFFNLIGAIIWAPVIAGVGYLAGHAMQQILKSIQHAAIILVAVLICAGLVGWVLHRKKH